LRIPAGTCVGRSKLGRRIGKLFAEGHLGHPSGLGRAKWPPEERMQAPGEHSESVSSNSHRSFGDGDGDGNGNGDEGAATPRENGHGRREILRPTGS